MQMIGSIADYTSDVLSEFGHTENKNLRQSRHKLIISSCLSKIESNNNKFDEIIKKSNKLQKRIITLLNESPLLSEEKIHKLNKKKEKLEELILDCQRRIKKEEKIKTEMLANHR